MSKLLSRQGVRDFCLGLALLLATALIGASAEDTIKIGIAMVITGDRALEGEYGRTGIAMGVPCVLAGEGIARVIELPLDAQEQAMFDHSADQVLRDIAEMNAL